MEMSSHRTRRAFFVVVGRCWDLRICGSEVKEEEKEEEEERENSRLGGLLFFR